MNSNLIEIISQYLKIETNYAIIINGDYGVGKTHFFKNELSPKIREISLAKDEQKKYTPIHISLFGFKTLEEIQTAIFVELFPILKNKNLKLAAGIGKSIIRGIAQLNGAGDIDKYIGDITQDADEWLNYDELVICFDDLDRKSESLDIRDVFGFINSLVENQGVKILFIANEEQLTKDKNYSSTLREKVIGVSVPYAPNPTFIYDQIVSDRYQASSKIYYGFLLEHKTIIVSAIKKNKNNFRNLIFFLEHFSTIFYALEKIFSEDKDFNVLKKEKQKAVLNFSLAISIEYKLGFLNSDNIEKIKDTTNILLPKIDFSNLHPSNKNQEEEKSEPTYLEVFKGKYFSEYSYYFFKSVFDYITGSKAFDTNNLKNELNNHFITEEGKLPKQELVLKELGYLDCLKLSNKEYRKKTYELLSYVDESLFQLNQYGTVFHFVTRFDNMLNLDLTNLKERFKKGIRKGISKYKYRMDLGFYMSVSSDSEFVEDLTEIVQYCLEINGSLNQNTEKEEIKNYIILLESDFEAFYDKTLNRDSQTQLTPFWLQYDINKVYRIIRKLRNDQTWKLAHYFRDRYRRHIYDKILPEKEFVTKMIKLIDNGTKERAKKSLENASLNYLSKCLNESLLNFEE